MTKSYINEALSNDLKLTHSRNSKQRTYKEQGEKKKTLMGKYVKYSYTRNKHL